ncbi:MAG: hypothetical protein HY290_18405 [Planctomycetia bacterium]|nr:hypothetical protein [Planctomycetia bacterium]
MTGIHMRDVQGYSDGMPAPATATPDPLTDKSPRPWRSIPLSLRTFEPVLLRVGIVSALLIGVHRDGGAVCKPKARRKPAKKGQAS